jgi:hypothetical protein
MYPCRLLAGLLVLGVLFGVGVPVSAQKDDKDKTKKEEKPAEKVEKVALKWKFEKNKEFFQKMTTDTTQTMKVMGNPVQQKQKQTFYFSWKPISQEGDRWTIEQKIIGVAMEIDIGGSKIAYDSQKENPANNPLAEFFKALDKASFIITLDTKSLKVTDIKGRQDFVDSLVKANPQMKPLLDTILSENALKEMAEPTFAVIPTEPVAPGKSWEKKTQLDMGPIGKYINTYKYTYNGKEGKDQLYKISVATTLEYKAPGDGVNQGGLPFKIKSAELKSRNAAGTIIFDNERGRVSESQMKLELEGTLNIEIGGQSTKVDLHQEQSSSVVTTDVDPRQKK